MSDGKIQEYGCRIEHRFDPVYFNSRTLMGKHWGVDKLLFNNFEINGLENVRAVQDKQVFYVSNHLSMADFLVQPYVLWDEGLTIPRIIAGENLNHWPFANLWKKCGAISVDRNLIKRDKTYAGVFSKILHEYLDKGENILNYAEGGRSYDGEIGIFQPGVVGIIAESVKNGRDIWAVPMHISYDKRVERFLSQVKKYKAKRDGCLRRSTRHKRKEHFFRAGFADMQAGVNDRAYFLLDVLSFFQRPFVMNKGDVSLRFGEGFCIKEFLAGAERREKIVLTNRLRQEVIELGK